jgi:hypothetical protein
MCITLSPNCHPFPLTHSPLLALIDDRCAGRAEFSKRQDWCVEASWKFHNLIQPINLYCIETLVLDANILRDSILTRVEQIRSAHLSHPVLQYP